MHNEFGGYFEIEHNRGGEYHAQALALNIGRSALRYLIRARGITVLWMPKWTCDSLLEVCAQENVALRWYDVDRQTLQPVFDRPVPAGDWLYIINYFGLMPEESIRQWKKDHDRLILDNAQAFFARPLPGVDTLYTCRKFFGVTDGGYLYTDARLAEPLETDASLDRLRYLFGRLEGDAGRFYADFRKNEDSFSAAPMRWMSPITRNILRGIDYNLVRDKRTENFTALMDSLAGCSRLALTPVAGAYMFPLLTEHGNRIRRELIARSIFVPTLWPNVLEDTEEGDAAYDLTDNMIILPCDQRYDADDMQYIASVVKQILREQGE